LHGSRNFGSAGDEEIGSRGVRYAVHPYSDARYYSEH
jgi:hypothetical protein